MSLCSAAGSAPPHRGKLPALFQRICGIQLWVHDRKFLSVKRLRIDAGSVQRGSRRRISQCTARSALSLLVLKKRKFLPHWLQLNFTELWNHKRLRSQCHGSSSWGTHVQLPCESLLFPCQVRTPVLCGNSPERGRVVLLKPGLCSYKVSHIVPERWGTSSISYCTILVPVLLVLTSQTTKPNSGINSGKTSCGSFSHISAGCCRVENGVDPHVFISGEDLW